MTPHPTNDALVVDLNADLLGGNLADEAFWAAIKQDWRNALVRQPRTSISPDEIDIEHLPWDEDTLARLEQARHAGRRCILQAETPELAARVGAALGLFDETRAAPTGAQPRTQPRPTRRRGPILLETLHAMRPHQWVKNLLVFLPMLLDHSFTLPAFGWSLVAFLSFSAIASGVYLLNDLSDLAADRRHPTKRARPFAAGRLPLALGTRAVPLLFATGFVLAALGGWSLALVMLLYAVTTTAYSFRLKGLLAADVIVLAVLYTLRMMAGSAATGIAPSMWFLSFAIFIFLSLGAVKRLAELTDLVASEADSPGHSQPAGRAYITEDRPVIAMIATSAGFGAVLVLALYMDSAEVRAQYDRPEVLWGVSLVVLFWISRTVLLAHRGEVNQDPVIFALTDKASRWAGLVTVLLVFAASVG
ncbi:MAG TPA: UbiA family prenyltransferase [Rhodobacterales bacterium]|nr:UbiA family prenyltransferase [Rhodobacterales bacterium]